MALRSGKAQRLHIAQFASVPTQADRTAITALGGQVIGYLPDNAYIVRIAGANLAGLQSLASVRWVGDYHPAYRLDPELQKVEAWSEAAPVRYNFVVADKHNDKAALAEQITALGGVVEDLHTGSLLFSATLTGPQLLQAAGLDQVLWIDKWSPEEVDMDNARIQGGGNYVEAQAGYTGTGVNAHIYEGIEASHPDFTGTVTPVNSANTAQTHGHATGGIVFGNGNSNPAVRGMAPDAGKFFTNYNAVTTSRYQVFDDLVNVHNVSHTTASWGNARTFFYTSISAESDDIVFDHDLAWTQSQSNAGNQDSRPQAWAKNVFSIGGVRHQDDSNPNNDSWSNGGSTGPASDGRIKPTLCAYYDSIGTSDRTGSAGYSSGSWTASFGGTSGATPIVAGHNVIAIEMFTDDSATPGFGRFGNQLRVPGGTTHQNRPHFTTLKALQVVSARPYSFNAGSSDNRREHQGWGFPSLADMWDNRGKTYLVDETDVLQQGQATQHVITVAAGEPSLKISLNWNEPAANPAAAQHLVNNLSLRVTSPSGTVYWGNTGLESGVWSVAGGSEDTVNTIENVFVQNPAAGTWNVDVIASSVVADNHVETGAVDADYALVVSGGVGQTGGPGSFASYAVVGTGCGGTSIVCDEALYEYPNFDLANSSWSLAFDGTKYTLIPGAGTWITPSNALSYGDDTVNTQTLPFTLAYPGGSTTQLDVCSNGWVSDGTYAGGNNYEPTPAKFLQNTMWAALWRDLNPSNGGDVYFDANSQRAVVSWLNVPNFSNTGSNTVQIQFWNDGSVNVIYQAITVSGDYLVGFGLSGAADPGSTDISASLNGTVEVCSSTAGTPDLALDATARPVVGTTFDMVTTNVPATSVGGISILSAVPLSPAFDLTSLGMPGCWLYQELTILGQFGVAGGSGQFSFAVPNDPNLSGAQFYGQTGALVLGINPFNIITSNGLSFTVGLN